MQGAEMKEVQVRYLYVVDWGFVRNHCFGCFVYNKLILEAFKKPTLPLCSFDEKTTLDAGD